MPRSFFVGLPNFTARTCILNSMLRNVPKGEGLDISEMARVTGGYSPSDLKEVLRTAALFPLREARSSAMMERQHRINNGENVPITLEGLPPLRSLRMEDVLEAKDKVAPTLYTPTYKAALEDYARRASAGRVNIFGTNKFQGQFGAGNSLTQPNYLDKTVNQMYNIHPMGDNRFYTDAGSVLGDYGSYQNKETFQNDFFDESSEDDYDEDDDSSSSSVDSSFQFD
uniref:AAA ATPase AAA+ lid domain-containing protein n=1 Tax=Eucampia antarctica TaxID=49252 RepID=A0A7S2R1P4_9STRA|mmetsp:Transcript_13174/g.12795  ORF Transcript_13174/g.12795 Transcript_13174/m.12795 type:complete len:226 (+) Transcript_13174:3-680(+)